ncbi:hypothetical protein EJ110_NYTH54660 [Nymphaea thermarum]|nr:hypothetical protein EJ110_NYTH54660 [Nymphaea thermarum]
MAPEELDVKPHFRLVLHKAIPLKAIPSPLMEMQMILEDGVVSTNMSTCSGIYNPRCTIEIT